MNDKQFIKIMGVVMQIAEKLDIPLEDCKAQERRIKYYITKSKDSQSVPTNE